MGQSQMSQARYSHASGLIILRVWIVDIRLAGPYLRVAMICFLRHKSGGKGLKK